MRATRPRSARGREVPDLPAGDLFPRHRQVVLRAGLDERRRGLVEADALTELMVIVVDLPRSLRRHEHECVARAVHLVEQIVEAWIDHRPAMVPARATSHSTSATRAAVALSMSSFRTM